MGEIFLKGRSSRWIYSDRFGDWIVSVGPHRVLQALSHCGLLFRTDRIVVFAEFFFGEFVQDKQRFAMQIIGCPVGCYIAAVTPDRANLHAAHRLPDVLTILNIISGHKNLAVAGDNLAWNRRGLMKYFAADPTEHRKGNDHYSYQKYPKSFHFLPLF